MSGRTTQVYHDAAGRAGADTWITSVHKNALGRSDGYRRKVTQVYVDLMGKYPLNTGDPAMAGANRFTQVWANVMIPFTPNFEWIDMFINEVFPHDISYNSIGATRFVTDVVIVDSGHDQRNSRWDQPLMEYDVAYGVRTMEHLHGLIAFFRAMRGRKHAFLYHDYVDYKSTIAVDEEVRKAPEVSPFDQQLGVGNHIKKSFQLAKRYPTPGGLADQVRPIYRPQPDTVRIAVAGVEVTNWGCDYERGVITFTSNWSKTDLNGMRIDPDTVPNRWVITGPTDTFTGLANGDKIVTRGWLNPNNNSTEVLDLIVSVVAADGSTVTFDAPAGYGELETNRNGVEVYRHPAPKAGVLITAGYHFYVPVRFDTDRLPVSIEEYGIGGAGDVRLVEVRPSEVFDE